MYGYQYDQLNRIAAMDGFTGLNVSANTWAALTATPNYRERITYDANGNILTYQRNGNKSSQQLMDDLSYHYNYNTSGTYAGKLINNQLNYVSDAVTNTTAYSGNDPATGVEDLETQAANNYAYDEIGNLVQDTKEGISNITWSVYGKILSIQKATGTITYTYDASGNRITKTYNGKTTWYVRDATGNVMSIYDTDATLNSGHLTQTEVHLYGSSRLGIFRINRDVNSITKADYTVAITTFTRGNKFFELSNHLGNVLATISDRKVMQLPDNDGCTPGSGKPTLELDYHTYEDEIVATQDITLLPGFETWDNETHTIYINETLGVCPPTDPANPPTASFYRADVISANDYYPFGMTMPGRKFSSSSSTYRYGFNGKENDNEVKGEGNQQDYGMRIYDTRLGRFLSVDPLTKSYPHYTPYSYAGNKPIKFIDLDGLEEAKHWYDYSFTDLMQWMEKPSNPVADNTFIHKAASSFNRNFNPIYDAWVLTTGKDFSSSDYPRMTRTDAAFNLETKVIFGKGMSNLMKPNASVALEQQMLKNEAAMGANSASKGVVSNEAPKVAENNISTVAPAMDKISRRKLYAESVFKSAGKDAGDVQKLMNTVDFKRAVSEKVLNVGDKVYRFERINSKGGDMHFYTDAIGADAGPTGVGFAAPDGYKLVTYEVTKKTTVMQSTIKGTGNKQFFSTDLQKNINKVGEE